MRKTIKTVRQSKLIRMALLLVILMFCTAIFLSDFRSNMQNAYAITYSLGNGKGIIIYSPLYYTLDPALQESVRDHEERHLEVGSYQFWRHNKLEVDAYDFQIERIDRRLGQYMELYHKTKDSKHLHTVYLLRDFRRAMVIHKKRYQGIASPEESEND